jgi:hypothetical protein
MGQQRSMGGTHGGAARRAGAGIATLLLLLMAVPAVSAAADPARRCERGAAARLRVCAARLSLLEQRCQLDDGGPCPLGDRRVARALGALERRVRRHCPNDAAVRAAGYGPLLTVDALVGRLAEACRGAAATLTARGFGGPGAAALAQADDGQRTCLTAAHEAARRLIERSMRAQSACVLRARAGRSCDTATLASKLAGERAIAVGRMAAACPALASLVALTPEQFADHAAAQARCLVARVHGDPAPLGLDCGPRAAVQVPARGVNTQVLFDEATWGTRCGDGSSYAVQVRLAPAGAPLGNVLIFMQGGGVCLLESDCAGVSTGLLRATDNTMPSGGIFSTNPVVNPTFHDWTLLFLPYCTQDLHIGGGTTSSFPSRTVHRFGGVNVRAALRWLRDVLWTELDATTAQGFRPDELRVVLSGGSAGGFGTSYNYHYVLDELGWTHTTALSDSALGLHNGEIVGIGSLFALVGNSTPPLGWGNVPLLPPYCFAPACAAVPFLHARHAERLGVIPEQRILSVSNQVDTVQVNTTFFPSLPAWITAARQSYCAQQGLPGLGFFLPANGGSLHGVLNSNTHLASLSAAGVPLGAWVDAAIGLPAGTADAVDEGALAAQYGVAPFSCPLAP